jgi:crotonobetainyl-CoA:carnitine CoA-transferase CaiB-like acyl-CoA transferase
VSETVVAAIWSALGGPADSLDRVAFTGPAHTLPGPFLLDDFAAATIAAATLAVAGVDRTDRGPVTIDRRHASLAFRSEAYLRLVGWELPGAWDPIAGDYPTADGWIRLHTNYERHRAAAVKALGLATDAGRDAVADAVAGWAADDLEQAVVAGGGCAATQRGADAWRAHPQGAAVAAEPLVAVTYGGDGAPPHATEADGASPLGKVRVLDLTRVIAGPIASRFLAAYGADVLRIDPPGFAEIPGLVVETTAGKRRAAIDLATESGRRTMRALVAEADVVVHGYRPGALAALGFDDDELRAIQPGLVIASLDAYGWSGPWHARRGFDSLVQHSTGITTIGQEARGAGAPVPLPAQALDHGTGYLIAAAIARALADGRPATIRASLARTAAFLVDLGLGDDPDRSLPPGTDVAPYRERAATPWGPVDRVRPPGRIGSFSPAWTRPPSELGDSEPAWI